MPEEKALLNRQLEYSHNHVARQRAPRDARAHGRGAFTTAWRRCTRSRPCSFTRARTAARWRLRDWRRHARARGGHRVGRDVPPAGARPIPNGATMGVDLSPNMAARTQRRARREFPGSRAHCQAVDARHMPFRDGSFDAVVCCYLLELLSPEDIVRTVREFHRVLRRPGKPVAGADRPEHGGVQPALPAGRQAWRRRSGDGRWSAASRT